MHIRNDRLSNPNACYRVVQVLQGTIYPGIHVFASGLISPIGTRRSFNSITTVMCDFLVICGPLSQRLPCLCQFVECLMKHVTIVPLSFLHFSEDMAKKVEHSHGRVFFVPAFSGLKATYWWPDATG